MHTKNCIFIAHKNLCTVLDLFNLDVLPLFLLSPCLKRFSLTPRMTCKQTTIYHLTGLIREFKRYSEASKVMASKGIPFLGL